MVLLFRLAEVSELFAGGVPKLDIWKPESAKLLPKNDCYIFRQRKKINKWSTSVWQLLESSHSISTTHPFCPWDHMCLASSRKTWSVLQIGEPWGQRGAHRVAFVC